MPINQNCLIENGYPLGCVQTGGIESVWIGTYSSDFVFTLDADNIITDVASGTPTVYKFDQDIESASLVQNGVFSRENLTTYLESVLIIKLFGWTPELRNTYNALVKAPLIAVVKMNTGTELVYLGLESAGRATEGVLQAGQLLGDMNGATLTFTWKSANGGYMLDPAVLGDPDGIIIGNTVS